MFRLRGTRKRRRRKHQSSSYSSESDSGEQAKKKRKKENQAIYRRRKIYCIELIMHTPCIPVSMLALDLTAGGVMNIHVEDGVLERTQH